MVVWMFCEAVSWMFFVDVLWGGPRRGEEREI